MPTAKSAADAKKPKAKAAASKDKEKKKEKKDRAERKDRPRAKKSESSADDQRSRPEAAPDPDAVQLFRRYDRARSGLLLRRDFLQLLRDYAQPPLAVPRPPHDRHRLHAAARQPLSLTDSRGIPLGYERSDKNSEFEAGQLFERYDRDQSGTLSLDEFHVFFRDFDAQLRAFVDDLSYAGGEAQSSAAAADDRQQTTKAPQSSGSDGSKHHDGDGDTQRRDPSPVRASESSRRAAYQATLWELRKLCQDELQQQRGRIVPELARLRERLDASPRRSPRAFGDPYDAQPAAPRPSRWSSPWSDNQLADRHDAMESDLERLDHVLRVTRRQLRRGMDASPEEMDAFLARSTQLLQDARELAMKLYGSQQDTPRRDGDQERHSVRERDNKPRDERGERPPLDRDAGAASTPIDKPPARQPPPAEMETLGDLQRTLRVKDQIIYRLLQERTTLRREKAAMEADLHELTQVSTDEMRKWARLTDDMQEEIAVLRDRVRGIGRHGDDGHATYE